MMFLGNGQLSTKSVSDCGKVFFNNVRYRRAILNNFVAIWLTAQLVSAKYLETTIVSSITDRKNNRTEKSIFTKNSSRLYAKWINRFKNALGPSAEEILSEENKAIREERQRLGEAEKQLKETERILL